VGSSLWDRLSSKKTEPQNESYRWGGSPAPSAKSRPWTGSKSTSTTTAGPRVIDVKKSRQTNPKETLFHDPTDRPLAHPPALREEGHIQEWRPHGFWQIMADLGLRAIEVAISAMAYEVAVFFTRRRFVYTPKL